MTFAFIESLPAVYAERLLSGLFAAAVTPVALAAIGDLAATEVARARRLTFVSLAGTSGFLFGPMMGVFIARSAATLFPAISNVGPLVLPLAGTAVLALLAAIAAILTVPGKAVCAASPERGRRPVLQAEKWLVPRLLALAFIV